MKGNNGNNHQAVLRPNDFHLQYRSDLSYWGPAGLSTGGPAPQRSGELHHRPGSQISSPLQTTFPSQRLSGNVEEALVPKISF
ncbi:unnamed protein product [Arctogadus glacialis]